GGIFAFIVSFDQFPVSLFLVVPKGETLPVVLFNYMKFDLDGAIAAASMVSIALALSVVILLEWLIGLRAYLKLYMLLVGMEELMRTSQRARRQVLLTGAAAAATIAAPAVVRAQAATLKITTWGGKWGEIMKGKVLPAFEKEFKCTVEADQAFPYLPKLQASPKTDPIYDVLHSNSNEQWQAVELGIVERKITAKEVPNIADVYPYAISDKIVGVSIFTSAIGLGFRTDKGLTAPTSWNDLAAPSLAGQRGGYLV